MTASAEHLPAHGEIVYLVRSWPRLSQTFVLDEVINLERRGLRLRVVALAASDEDQVQPEVSDAAAPVHYLDHVGRWPAASRAHLRAAGAAPAPYLRAVWHTLRHRDGDDGYHVASRWQRLTLAAELSALLRSWSGPSAAGVAHLHAHFAHDPAAVAYLTNVLTAVPWSFTGHARDVWQVPAPALATRVRSARFAVTCNRDVADRLRSLAGARADRVRLVHHGVDVDLFRPDPAASRASDGGPLIVSVGRLVEKKGFQDLLEALRLVSDGGRGFRCTIYGDGPLRADLADRIDRLGLSGVVRLAGARTRGELRREMQRADVFALTPHVAADGDRDGIPNVVVEAMACGLAVVATATGGIPEIVDDGHNGLLAPPRDVAAIADLIATALDDAGLRARLGAAARDTTVEAFDARVGAGALAALFAEAGRG